MVAPLPPSARDDSIDALRGLALLGVLVMNLPEFAGSPLSTGWVESILPGRQNLGPAVFAWLGRGKFVGILAWLYGFGIARRRAALGEHFIPVEGRRLAFLGALGVLHGLWWPGDILVAWAITGGLLLAGGAAGVEPTSRPRASRLVVLVGLCASAVLTFAGYGVLVEPARRAVVAGHLTRGVEPLLVAWRYLPFTVPLMVAQAMLGAAAGARRGRHDARHDLAPDGSDRRPADLDPAPVGALWLIGGGLCLSAVPAVPLLLPLSAPAWVSMLCGDLGATALAAGVATLVVRTPPARWHAALAPIGAAPLSNYLLQSLIFVTFRPPRMHAPGYLLLAAVTFTAQAALSAAWLRRHPRGPVEALWRRVSYRATV